MSKITLRKKDILLTTIVAISLIILILLLIKTFTYISNINKAKSCDKFAQKFIEENKDTIFSIDKIVYFSSCDGQTSINGNSSFTISNLYQYTDIAIFINNTNSSDEFTAKNTLKNVSLDNINFSLSPSVGTPSLYYKNLNDFASSKYNIEHKIENSINFEATSENQIDYNSPKLYNNCANPICLTYINENIKKDYTLKNTISNLSYNGLLLKYCNITLNSIACQISMTINITNNLDEHFSCPITIQIPLSTENSTIYDGNITLKHSVNYKFIKNI